MIVNGIEMKFNTNITVIELLQKLEIDKDKVVIEINLEIISKENYNDRIINEDDKIEIVGFVGGG